MKKVELFSTLLLRSLYLMSYYPHSMDILSWGEQGSRRISIEQNLKIREVNIKRLIDFASHSISKPKESLKPELLLLKLKLGEYTFVNKQIDRLKEKMEQILLQTDGGIL